MKTLSDIGELPLIQKISKILRTKDPSVLCGIGDDAAVLRFGNKKLLFKTDALLESVHFDWRFADPFLLGRKSLSVNLSDIAAMGGTPRWALISIALPSDAKEKSVKKFFQGLKSCAKEFRVSVVGGDTDRSPKGWKITVALLGDVKKPIFRSGAKVGDQIWVTGFLGCSALGLGILRKGALRRGDPCDRPHFLRANTRFAPTSSINKFIQAHLDPLPRVREGLMLAKENLATSLIDVSDGLCLDLAHLCQASHVGAKVYWENVPLAPGFFDLCRKIKKDPLALSLGGGEDYELLFTASPRNQRKILEQFRRLGTKVTCIGEVVSPRQGLKVLGESGRPLRIPKKGYQHF